MEKIDLPSANSFTVDERLLLILFMYIRRNSRTKIEHWGTSAGIGDHEDAWPFKRIRWNLPLKKLLVSFRGVP